MLYKYDSARLLVFIMINTMPKTPDCRFCQIMNGYSVYGKADLPFSESSEFVSMASIGSLVEGWSLVIPRKHCLSLQDYYGTAEFSRYVQEIVQKIEAEYGPAVIFEHGSNHCGSLTGCGIDHAHLHIVPQLFPLAMMLAESGISAWHQARASEIRSLAEGGEYLFFLVNSDANDPIGFFKKVEQPSSQFFRRAIAAVIGKTDVADYKKHPFLDTSIRTQERLVNAA